MVLLNSIKELNDVLSNKGSKSIGFVPTMGALHNGHLSLIKKCSSENDLTVISIFVNPTQFNDAKDLKNYPRTLDADLKLLQETKCDIVFNPSTDEIYPEEDTREYHFGKLETVLEGKHRPGHFRGVAMVVRRLFEIVKPDNAYFGEKDFQQLLIVKKLVNQFKMNINVVGCPIIREASGLAMSSRNTLLSDEKRKIASNIYQILKEATEKAINMTVSEVEQWVVSSISNFNEFKIEYFSIVNDTDMQPVEDWKNERGIVGCIAVKIDNVRLIDNIRFNL